VLEGLKDIDFNGQHLRAQLASVGIQQVSGLESGISAMSVLAGTQAADLHEGRVLQLLNMVTPEELMDNDEYEGMCPFWPMKHLTETEILEDVREECEKYGRVEDLKIPRPSGSRANPGVGKIFVKFDGDGSARKAMKALAGRKFADRTVVVTYFGEEYFDVNAW
jgi:splicing factor U2AF 65 kDa subunit